jgi:hypothetical protein
LKHLVAALGLLILLPPAGGDTVRLPGGTELTGVVLERSETRVRLLLPGGSEVSLLATDVAEVRADDDAPKAGQVARWTDRGTKGAALQVPVVTYVSPDARRRVDLVGAVHVADRSYYREVQALLEGHDVVLYEMVKPEDRGPEEEPEEANPVRDLQRKMATWLELSFQLDEISYDRPHFVHADLTPEQLFGGTDDGAGAGGAQLQAMMPLLQMAMGAAERMLGGDDAAARGQRATLKRTMGRLLGSLGSRVGALLGSQMSEALIDRRDAVVIERLAEVPEGTRSVGVFYGTAHLPDLEKRLEAIGWRRAGGRWLDAWTVPAATVPAPAPGK